LGDLRMINKLSAGNEKVLRATAGGQSAKGSTNPPPLSPSAPAVPAAVTPMWPTLNPPTGSPTMPTDTNFGSEWNLTSTTGGIDIAGAWRNYTGLGVKIGVVDDG